MKNGFDFFDKTFHKEIYQNMVDEERHTLVQTLIRMQTEQGISTKEAAATAGACIAAVTSCESVRGILSENSETVVDQLLAVAEKCDDAELILHKLYFGVAVYPDFVAKNNQMPAEELFWRYYNENKDEKSMEVLKTDIRNVLTDYRLTPEVMQALTRKMEATGDYLAVATALGEGGISFKCITAMELYLSNGGALTIHEAANVACAEVEVQAAADAVGQGLITREMAKKILIIAGITLAVVGLGILIYYAGSAATLASAAAGAVDQLVFLPQAFAEFAATVTLEGAPVAIFKTADTVKNELLALAKAAEHKEILGGIAAALGVATVAVSRKTADLIGKYRAGFTTDHDRAKAGLSQIADHVQAQQQTVPAKNDLKTRKKALAQQQAQPAKLGAK